MINNEKAILNAKLNKSESEKNTGKKMNKKLNLFNKFIKGGITLAVAASLFACGTKEPEHETKNYSPIIHNEFVSDDLDNIQHLIDESVRVFLTKTKDDETIILDMFDGELLKNVNNYVIHEGFRLGEGDFSLYLPKSDMYSYYISPEWSDGYTLDLKQFDNMGKRYSLKKFMSKEEISPTLKFITNNSGEIVSFLDIAAVEDYIQYMNNEFLLEDEEKYELPISGNTDKDKAVTFDKVEYSNDHIINEHFVGLDLTNYKYVDLYDYFDVGFIGKHSILSNSDGKLNKVNTDAYFATPIYIDNGNGYDTNVLIYGFNIQANLNEYEIFKIDNEGNSEEYHDYNNLLYDSSFYFTRHPFADEKMYPVYDEENNNIVTDIETIKNYLEIIINQGKNYKVEKPNNLDKFSSVKPIQKKKVM